MFDCCDALIKAEQLGDLSALEQQRSLWLYHNFEASTLSEQENSSEADQSAHEHHQQHIRLEPVERDEGCRACRGGEQVHASCESMRPDDRNAEDERQIQDHTDDCGCHSGECACQVFVPTQYLYVGRAEKDKDKARQ